MENTFPYDNLAAAVAAARDARQRGDLETAAHIYRRIPTAFPENKQAVTAAADGLKECGHGTDAVALLEAALQKWPVSALYLSSLADLYHAANQPARAAGYMQRYLDYDDRNPVAWLHLADLHTLADNHAAAEAAYAGVLERDPMNVRATIGRGHSLFHLSRFNEAIVCYRRAVMMAPQDAAALFALGSALMTQGSEAEGHEHIRRSLEIEPHNARAHVNLGLTYFNTGNVKDAAIAARNALLIDGELLIAHVLLGMALAEGGDLEGAATALSKSVAASVHNEEALFALAEVQTLLGNTLAAELALQRVLTATPHNSEARHLLAAIHGAAIFKPEDNYSRWAFDRIAPRFDNQEIRLRDYRVPAEIANLIEEFEPARHTIARLADAGCGTGLTAAALRDAFAVNRAVGIDVSPNMINIASATGLYDEIIIEDATRILTKLSGTFEVISAGDLFPYIGDLAAFMAAARARLAPGGLLAYSIELSGGSPLKLAPNGRFVHSADYVEETARAAGLQPVASRPISLRRSFGQDVPGLVGLLRV